jgi:antitoxin CptB
VKPGNDRPPDTSGSQEQFKRLRWQCRRGMKELDQLLTGYLENSYAAASDDDKAAFHALLDLSDPELVGYLLQRKKPGSEIVARGIDIILGRDRA